MKLLVIGCNGQLGWEICRQGEEKGFDIMLPLWEDSQDVMLRRFYQ
jgi:dTDP-4-dehydrorhamnose reductase